MRKQLSILLIGLMPIVARADDEFFPTARLIGRGDIHRSQPPTADKPWIPLYQGNGRFGCCYGPWGLHLQPGNKPGYPLHGVTQYMHMKHWIRGKYNADYLLPVAAVYWTQEPQEVQSYEQHESFHDGTVRTRFATPRYRAEIVTWFDPVRRNVAGIQIDVEGEPPPIAVTPLRHLSVHYDQKLEATFEGKVEGQMWRAAIQCQNLRTPLTVKTNAPIQATADGIQIVLKAGRNDILVAVGDDEGATAEDSLPETIRWWHTTWEHTASLSLPDDDAQKVWVRSMAYTLYSHNDDGFGCSPPTGLVGNGWPFPFPFDSGCRQPLLLWTGQIDAARKWVEFWASKTDGLRKYTRRIWKLDGIMLPHVFPYGPVEGYHMPDIPNDYYAPIYNSGHMARIAHQTAVMVNDPEWTKKYAVPLIEGAARFYLDMAKKGDDGLWHFTVIPSIGLDEDGGRNQPDYFCTLVSAEYSFERAIEYGLDADGRMANILKEGIAYKSLLTKDGMYAANAGTVGRELGQQKHPDQFAPFVHIPLDHEPDAATRRCFEKRYDITNGAKIPRFMGHTLGEILLADARMHDVDGWRKEWATVQPSKNADPDWIQFYESGGSNLAFYVTTHGLFAQAILETIVSTWWGRLELAPCIPWKGLIRIENVRTLLGVSVNGFIVEDGRGRFTLEAWKDTHFKYLDQTITMKKGETKDISIGKW